MNLTGFIRNELGNAIARGVRQCVVIGSKVPRETFEKSSEQPVRVFAVSEEQGADLFATFVRTQFGSESLATALGRSSFDRLRVTLFVWLGGAYRTFDAAISTLAFIASLPRESAVLFDYAAERSSTSPVETALDALASRICANGDAIKHLIQPQAVAAMLRGLGFRSVVDLPQGDLRFNSAHLVSAVV